MQAVLDWGVFTRRGGYVHRMQCRVDVLRRRRTVFIGVHCLSCGFLVARQHFAVCNLWRVHVLELPANPFQ